MAGGGIMAPPGGGTVAVADWKGFVWIFPALNAAALTNKKTDVCTILKQDITFCKTAI